MGDCHGNCGSCKQKRRGECRTIIWRFKNDYPYKIYLKFYSQDRNHVWPGGGKVYVLDDGREHTFHIRGLGGEKVCYGAWVAGDSSTYWGVGKDNEHGCSDCCYYCEGVTAGLVRFVDW